MAKYKNYTEYICECGQPASPQSIRAIRKDGTLAPRVSTLTKKPCCSRCLNNDVAKKSGKADTYAEMQNIGTYREKKYEVKRCQNINSLLGFRCGMREDFFDGSEDSIKILEVDHIDGNPSNNSDDNLRVLCPPCHRIKGWNSGDSRTPGRKSLGITKVGIRTFS